jgi:hypothetical protein
MTRNTIDMAREANLAKYGDGLREGVAAFINALERFEALARADERNRTWTQEHWTDYECSIAAAEREACAKVCDDINAKYKWPDDVAERVASQWCADAIRARGNT